MRLSGREIGLATSGGFAWGCFNASLVAIIAFGPGLLIARGVSLSDAGFVVSLAIWLTIVLGADRRASHRPSRSAQSPDRRGEPGRRLLHLLLPALTHPMLAFCLVGLAIGAPPGALMALLPKAVASERLATTLGVYYTTYYVVMAVVQLAAGAVRDVFGSPAAPIVLRRARHGVDDRRLRGVPTRRSELTALTRPER